MPGPGSGLRLQPKTLAWVEKTLDQVPEDKFAVFSGPHDSEPLPLSGPAIAKAFATGEGVLSAPVRQAGKIKQKKILTGLLLGGAVGYLASQSMGGPLGLALAIGAAGGAAVGALAAPDSHHRLVEVQQPKTVGDVKDTLEALPKQVRGEFALNAYSDGDGNCRYFVQKEKASQVRIPNQIVDPEGAKMNLVGLLGHTHPIIDLGFASGADHNAVKSMKWAGQTKSVLAPALFPSRVFGAGASEKIDEDLAKAPLSELY